MQNNPVENTKNTPKAAANSHRNSGNFSGLNFFPVVGDSVFASSLVNCRPPISTTSTPRCAAIDWEEDENFDVNNDRKSSLILTFTIKAIYYSGQISRWHRWIKSTVEFGELWALNSAQNFEIICLKKIKRRIFEDLCKGLKCENFCWASYNGTLRLISN